MDVVVEDPSPAAVLPALEANVTAFWLPYGRAPGSQMSNDSAGAWFYTGVPHPLFNAVVTAVLAPGAVEPLIDRFAGFVRARGAPAFWWVGPRSRPADLGARLQRRGLQLVGDSPGMAADLSRLPDPGEPPPGFSMKRADGVEAQALWATVAARGSGFDPLATNALVALERTLAGADYHAQHRYIGFLDGTPVATAALVLEAGVAGIYAVATVPEARNKGVGRLMTLMPFIEARDLGYRIGILQASDMGRPVYERLGFANVGTYRLYLQTG